LAKSQISFSYRNLNLDLSVRSLITVLPFIVVDIIHFRLTGLHLEILSLQYNRFNYESKEAAVIVQITDKKINLKSCD
jgi:hypothetical protein